MEKKSVGRPKSENPKKMQIKFYVDENENEIIEHLAKKYNTNKAKLVRNIVLGNIDDLFSYSELRYLPIFNRIIEERENMAKIDEIINDIKKEED